MEGCGMELYAVVATVCTGGEAKIGTPWMVLRRGLITRDGDAISRREWFWDRVCVVAH